VVNGPSTTFGNVVNGPSTTLRRGRRAASPARPLARMLNLAGRAEMPSFFDMDDALR
jgi:hypothetical protein